MEYAPDGILDLSLRNWPDQTPHDAAVSTLIARIQRQRGHFRDLNEAVLEAELAGPDAADGATQPDGAASPPTEPPTEPTEPPDDDASPGEKRAKAKAEMIELLG